MLRLAFDFIITWRETRTRPNAYQLKESEQICIVMNKKRGASCITTHLHFH